MKRPLKLLALGGAFWGRPSGFRPPWRMAASSFLPAPEHGHVDLVYFGHIKDTDGNYLDSAEMTIHVDGIGMTFPFDNDSVGHYRSPDVGAQIKDNGEAVDPSKITISCAKKGYKMVNRRPRRCR
jgi:hypothetical protein